MLYVIYNQRTDIDEVVTEELLDAVEDAGRIMDRTDEPDAYQVLVIDLTEESYNKHEQMQVLHFIADQMLIDELNRRIDEYRKYADVIREACEELRIYV